MAELLKSKKKSNTKYKVLGFSIAGVVVLTVSYFVFRSLKPDEEAPEETPVTPTAKKSVIKKTSSSKSEAAANVVSTQTPEPALVATISSGTAANIAEAIRRATYVREKDDYGKNWGLLLGAIGMIKNVKDYTLVNNIFLQVGIADRLLSDSVSMSIVTKTMVGSKSMPGFGTYPAYNRELTRQFIRIGLKASSDGKWSLNGLGSL